MSEFFERISNEELRRLSEKLRQYELEEKYFDEKYEILRREYPDEFVAIYNRTVIGHGKDLRKLREKLRESGIDPNEAYIRRTYFKEKPPKLLFRMD
jgi:hypothetical protein